MHLTGIGGGRLSVNIESQSGGVPCHIHFVPGVEFPFGLGKDRCTAVQSGDIIHFSLTDDVEYIFVFDSESKHFVKIFAAAVDFPVKRPDPERNGSALGIEVAFSGIADKFPVVQFHGIVLICRSLFHAQLKIVGNTRCLGCRIFNPVRKRGIFVKCTFKQHTRS